MSDFLTRLAARAVGERPAARPKLPAVFADTEPAAVPSVEPIEEDEALSERARERAPSEDAVAHAPLVRRTELRPRADKDAERAPGVSETREVAAAAPVEAAPRDAPDPSAAPPPYAPVLERDPPEDRAVTPAPPPRREWAPSRALRPARAVPAVRAEPAVADRAPRASVPAATAPARDEPAPVRVHIGRLEVRATLEQPRERDRRRHATAATPELSLTDYLRGKREAG